MKDLTEDMQEFWTDLTDEEREAMAIVIGAAGIALGIAVPKKAKALVGTVCGVTAALTALPLAEKLWNRLYPKQKKLVNGHQIEITGMDSFEE